MLPTNTNSLSIFVTINTIANDNEFVKNTKWYLAAKQNEHYQKYIFLIFL